MASHGKKRHVKRLAKPKAIPIAAKKYKYLKKTAPGPHGKEYSMPIGIFLVEITGLAETAREARMLLRAGKVEVDGRKVSEVGFPIGLMDMIAIPGVNKYFRIMISKGRLAFAAASKEAAATKLCRITSKRQLSKDKIQVNLHDGRNLIVADANKYATGGTLKLAVPSQEVKAYMPLQKGAKCLVYKGVHSGEVATLDALEEREASEATDAKLTAKDGAKFGTLKDYLFVVGDELN